ncbi:hypothetical protein ACFL6Y_02250 [Elusimicrobiota bacterium]
MNTAFLSILLVSLCALPLASAAYTQKNFETNWQYYSERVEDGANSTERLDILERLLIMYESSSLNLSKAKEEWSKLSDKNPKLALEMSLKHRYGKMVVEFVPILERIAYLEFLRDKFSPLKIDVSFVERELNILEYYAVKHGISDKKNLKRSKKPKKKEKKKKRKKKQKKDPTRK